MASNVLAWELGGGSGLNLLTDYLTTLDTRESEELLANLIQHQAAPVVRRIVARKVRGDAAHDVRNDVIAQLIARLREMKASGAPAAIRDFQAYSAVAAYHGCDEYYRQAYPQRARLRNRLRYLFGKDPRLALWQAPDGDWLCGPGKQARAKSGWGSSDDLLRVVESGFAEFGAPLPFDELVEHAARSLQIHDNPGENCEDLAAPGESVHAGLERRGWLRRVWNQIGDLPLPQRAALLLNLRDSDGGPALPLLPITGVASIRQIAARLEMPAERLAELWNHLPLDDLRIAGMLNVTRQQVINLRKSARLKLAKQTQ